MTLFVTIRFSFASVHKLVPEYLNNNRKAQRPVVFHSLCVRFTYVSPPFNQKTDLLLCKKIRSTDLKIHNARAGGKVVFTSAPLTNKFSKIKVKLSSTIVWKRGSARSLAVNRSYIQECYEHNLTRSLVVHEVRTWTNKLNGALQAGGVVSVRPHI